MTETGLLRRELRVDHGVKACEHQPLEEFLAARRGARLGGNSWPSSAGFFGFRIAMISDLRQIFGRRRVDIHWEKKTLSQVSMCDPQ